MTTAIDFSSPKNFADGTTLTQEHLNAMALSCKRSYMTYFDKRFPELCGATRFSILSAEEIAVEVQAIQKALWTLVPFAVKESKLPDDLKKGAIGFYDNFHATFSTLCAVIDKIWPSAHMTMVTLDSEWEVDRAVSRVRSAMDKLEELLKKRDAVRAKKQAQRERAAAKRAAKAKPY